MLMRDPKNYENKVRGLSSLPAVMKYHTNRLFADYVAKYANKDAAEEGGEDTESEDELSSVGSYESGGEEPAGTMDDV